jgi:uncharacterized membrane protein
VAATIFFIGAGLVYPVITSMNRTYGFTTHRYLDGLAAMRAGDPSEFEAVRWLEDNVEGTPTILRQSVATTAPAAFRRAPPADALAGLTTNRWRDTVGAGHKDA